MHILVTGGAGFIGSHVVDAFVAAGHHVAIVDNLTSGVANLNPEATFYEVDIRDTELLPKVFEREQPDVVSHHAAQISVGRSINEPLYDAEVNVLGTPNVLECARSLQSAGKAVHVIAISSAAVHGPPEVLRRRRPPAASPQPLWRKRAPPRSTWTSTARRTASRRQSCAMAMSTGRARIRGEAGVIAIFISKMLAGEAPTVNGSGEQTRDFRSCG